MQALLAGSSLASGVASTGLHPQPCALRPASVTRIATCPRPAPLLGGVVSRPSVNHPHSSTSCCAAKQPRDNRSFDSDEDLDADLAGELKSRVEPERLKNLANRLNLAWTIARSRTPEMCETCSGAKETECTWCHGTGFLMVGDSLVTIGRNGAGACPVCKGKGYSPCEHCRGTGYRAKWLGTNPPLES